MANRIPINTIKGSDLKELLLETGAEIGLSTLQSERQYRALVDKMNAKLLSGEKVIINGLVTLTPDIDANGDPTIKALPSTYLKQAIIAKKKDYKIARVNDVTDGLTPITL